MLAVEFPLPSDGGESGIPPFRPRRVGTRSASNPLKECNPYRQQILPILPSSKRGETTAKTSVNIGTLSQGLL
jgi:hypothetical protein